MYDKTESPKSFWEKMEDAYYNFCDSLEDKGIKVYEWFVNPLEDRGIPSLPVAIILLLLLLLGLGSAVFGVPGLQGQQYSLSVTVTDGDKPVSDAKVSLLSGEDLVSALKTKAGKVSFEDLKTGKYSLEVEKTGFELAKETVSIPDQKSVEILLKKKTTSASAGTQPSGSNTKNSNSLDTLDFASDSDSSLSLLIFVQNANNSNYIPAHVIVYDKTAGTKLADLDVGNDGYAEVTSDLLREGMIVYADAAANGFVEYYGITSPITLSASLVNSISIKLTPMSSLSSEQQNQFKNTTITVTDLQNAPVQYASVSIMKQGSATQIPIYPSSTNSSGQLRVVLNSSGNPDFRASVSKEGFETGQSDLFKAGDAVSVRLRHPGEYTDEEIAVSTNLTVIVRKEGQLVSGASVAIYNSQEVFRVDRTTGSDGKAIAFLLNMRGKNVTVNASHGVFSATSGEVLMDAEAKEVTIDLIRNIATVNVSAIDWLSLQSIPNAVFKAFTTGTQNVVQQCTASPEACNLTLGIGLDFDIEASAPGFVKEKQTFHINSDRMAIQFHLVNSSLVESTMVKDLKVFRMKDSSEVSVLYPGESYEARFTLYANTSNETDLYGFNFELDSTKAVITRIEPPSVPERSLGSESSECDPASVDWQDARSSWVEFSYPGSTETLSRSVKIRFDVKPLPEGVEETPFPISYRSFIVKNQSNGTLLYYRNPFYLEAGFNAEADSPLPSGCNAPAFDRNDWRINGVGVSCSDFACISVEFTQGNLWAAKNNFTAKFVSSEYQGLVSHAPVIMVYHITLKKNLASSSYADKIVSLMLSAPSPEGVKYLGLKNASYPGLPDAQGTPPTENKADGFTDYPTSYSVSLDHLKNYANMHAGFSFDGHYALQPLWGGVQGANLVFSISAGEEKTEITTLYNLEESPVSADDYTVIAIDDVKQFPTRYNDDPFQGVSTADCEQENTLPSFDNNDFDGACHHGYVEVDYSVHVTQAIPGAKMVFNNSVELPSSQMLKKSTLTVNDEEVAGFVSTVSKVEKTFGALEEGSLIRGKAYLIPNLQGDFVLSLQFSYSGLENNVEKQVSIVGSEEEIISEQPEVPPAGELPPISLLGPIPRDSCGNYIVVKYDPASQAGVQLQPSAQDKDCGSVQMRVTPLFPADAVPVTVSTEGELIVSVDKDDGSSACFESCLLNEENQVEDDTCEKGFAAFSETGNRVLRYNPEEYSQCEKFQVIGNEIKPSAISLKIASTVDASKPSFLNITVNTLNAFDAPSIFAGPIFSALADANVYSNLAYPRLWAVTNLKQIGPRVVEVYLAVPGDSDTPIAQYPPLEFDGPGTKTFALNPSPQNLIVVLQEGGKKIFVQGDPASSKIKSLNEYAAQFTNNVQIQGTGQTAQVLNLIQQNTGFDAATMKAVLDKTLKKAEQSAFWRSMGSAVCQKTPQCIANNYQPFDQCCRASADDWKKTIVTFTQSQESCRFCNNLGYAKESGNWDEQTQSCRVPIDVTKDAVPRCDNTFSPSTQAYCDSRCLVRDVEALDGSTSQKMGVVVSYGDSYKDAFDAQAQTCAADFAKGKTEILNTSYADCKKKGVFCPIISLKDASGDGKVKPICIPVSATKNGLLSSDESTDEDVPEDYQTAFAKFNDKGTQNNNADDVWYCESARI
ncbi:MAG: carboxypeptidase-like regulatory domain-containing protein, partial [Candidatus Micrarchaeota archaeon]